MKLSQFLDRLDIQGARPSGDYIGNLSVNPAMILEEKVPIFTRLTDIEDIEECLRIFQEKVCIPGFPARFSPQFWLAHAALSTIYQVMCSHLQSNFDDELHHKTNELLYHLWVDLITAGPGSSHLEMMDIIMKNQQFPLWKYMETLKGDKLQLLISTLRTDFVYAEEVSADHYATLMETHIDKIFRNILSNEQFEECRREMLDLYLFYLGRMNHVPPHIGPRLSHLCFLIFNRYPLENPYVGIDDWVLTRNHLRVIKEVITHKSFIVGSETQYRAPITLEKILEAAVLDRMLDIIFKDFMTLLLTLCNYGNCRKCKRLFVAYQSGLFEQLDFKKGFETKPVWLFDQCIGTLVQIANVDALETYIDSFIISTEHLCLLQFSKLSVGQVAQWHKLFVNHLVSGRALLVKEAGQLLDSPILREEHAFNWKTHVDTGRMLVDIISDLPWTFIQDNEDSCLIDTVQQYSHFLQQLLCQFRDQEVTGRYTDSVNRCVLKCTDHAKAAITLVCLKSEICDFKDMNFIREVLFTLDKLLKETDFTTSSRFFIDALLIMLNRSLDVFREKGYIAVDFNSLLMSICVSCASTVDNPDIDGETSEKDNMSQKLYDSVVKEFVRLHTDKGTLTSIGSLVPRLIMVIQECIQQGTSCGRCVDLLDLLGSSSIKILSDHTAGLVELLLDWGCLDIQVQLLRVYLHAPLEFVQHFQTMFDKLAEFEVTDRHLVLELLSAMSVDQTKLFTNSHISQLLNMYAAESQLTQQHILEILTNVSKVPSLMTASHCTMLIDSTKFSPLSLKQRAPILSYLSQQNEDFKKQTIEHLMQSISHKDGTVGLVAMKTLVPLVKDNPSYVQKQKMKFRNLWKTSSSADMKDLCAQLLPDIKYSGKKLEVNETPQRNVKAVTMPAKTKATLKPGKKPAQINRSSVMSPRLPTSPKDSAAESAVTQNKSPTAVGRNQDVIQNTVEVDKTKVPAMVHSSGDVSEHKAGVKVKAKAGLETVKIIESNEDKTKAKSDSKSVNCDSKTVLGDIPKVDMQTSEEEVTEAVSQGCMTQTGLSSKNERNFSKIPKIESPRSDNFKATVETKHTITDGTETICRPPVSIRSVGSQSVESLSRALKDAGYDNYIYSQSQAGDGATSDELKVLIYCIEDMPSSEILISEIKQLGSHITVIILKMKQIVLQSSGPIERLLKDQCSIRFYPKQGEKTLRGENWPRQKFCELLMQLNYYGILRNDLLVKQEFKNLWNLSEPTFPERTTATTSVTITTATPDVFISYHWGKQAQVEPLYHYLSSHGVPCWISVYHMSGSESLYNQIVQGVHSCRALIACLTSNYSKAANCKQEVTIAQKLNKPIIPLVLGETKWPCEGEVGVCLGKYPPLRISLTPGKVLDTRAVAMTKLLQLLSHHIPQLQSDAQTREITLDGEKHSQTHYPKTSLGSAMKTENGVSEEENLKAILNMDENKTDMRNTSKRYAKRSTSMFEIKKSPPNYGDMPHDGHLSLNEKMPPRGVTLDPMGYTVKSNRSKSCIIL